MQLAENMGIAGIKIGLPESEELQWTAKLITQVAEAMGGYNERVEMPQEIVPAIRRAQQVVAAGHPALLEIITSLEYSFSERPLGALSVPVIPS